MENKKYILGLDVSTSTIGICLFLDNGATGKLVKLTHLKFSGTVKTMKELWEKSELFKNFLNENFTGFDISRVIIEEPLITSSNPKTATKLNQFAGLIYKVVLEVLNVHPDYISVQDSRVFGLPELVGKNGKLMSDFPKKVGGLNKSHWGKLLILYLVGQRFKEVVWLLNSNLKIDKRNFDRADSIVAVLGYMNKNKHWGSMNQLWESANAKLDYPTCVKVIEKNMAYEKLCSQVIDKRKDLKKDEKNKVKARYLSEVFIIKDYLNVNF